MSPYHPCSHSLSSLYGVITHLLELLWVIHTAADEGLGYTEKKPTTHGAEGTEPLSSNAGNTTQERRAGSREFDEDIYGLIMNSHDSFRRQLADMRDNLNKVSITCDRLHDRRVASARAFIMLIIYDMCTQPA